MHCRRLTTAALRDMEDNLNTKAPSVSGNTNTHAGHRKRMRERYEKEGLDGFQPHEVLEMLLFRSIARGNTNPIAHALLDACGDPETVLEGKTAVHGVGETTLAMLRETGNQLEAQMTERLQSAERVSREAFYTAAVWFLRRHADGIFVMLTGQGGVFDEMMLLPAGEPAEILRYLKRHLDPEQCCHIACLRDPETLSPLRKTYGRTILGWCLCLSERWESVWI